MFDIVTVRTPLRISFLGGGSDIPSFYHNNGGGAVLSTTIDKYIYVTVKKHSPLFKERYRLNYYNSEHVDSLNDIQNDIVRACLQLIPIPPPIYIHTVGDLPTRSGLGSSSSFAVGLLQALHVLKGHTPTPEELAQEACKVELEILNKPIGKQDQYAAAFGGFNLIQFHSDNRVSTTVLDMPSVLFKSSLLFWTGLERDAAIILTDQVKNAGNNTAFLSKMRGDATEFGTSFCNTSIKPFALYLQENWAMKRQLSSLISTPKIDEWYNAAMTAGALGGKLLGAGGGGFLYFLALPDRHCAIRAALRPLSEVKVGYEPHGSKVIYSA